MFHMNGEDALEVAHNLYKQPPRMPLMDSILDSGGKNKAALICILSSKRNNLYSLLSRHTHFSAKKQDAYGLGSTSVELGG